MSNLAEQQNPLTMVDLLPLMQDAMNREADEYNTLCDLHEQLEQKSRFLEAQVKNLTESNNRLLSENEELATTLKKYEVGADQVTKNAEKHMHMLEQANRERDQFRGQVGDIKIQLKSFKEVGSTPKKIREKIKTLQDNVTKQRNAAETQKKNFLQERKDHEFTKKKLNDVAHKLAVSNISQAYTDGNDVVALFPHQIGEGLDGYEAGQIPLLYMHRSGRGGLILLNDDGEAELVSAPKGGLKPKVSTMNHCSVLLRRFQAQGYKLTNQDVEAIAKGSNL